MNLREAEAVVRERLGLDPAALGEAALPRALQERMKARAIDDIESYLLLLKNDANELQSVTAALAVAETWFFRGGKAIFESLAEFALARRRLAADPVRILSLPCSTGEEPFSIAMALLERGLPVEAFRIDAVDASRTQIDKAEVATYSSFSFREPGPDIRERHFRMQDSSRWTPLPQIRQAVRFRLGNISDPAFMANEPPYHIVVCRNLFIYLTTDARLRAIAALDRLLAVDGWLCVTPAEADRLPRDRFQALGAIESGIYQRVASVEKPRSSGSDRNSVVPAGSQVVRSSALVRPPEPIEVRTSPREAPQLQVARTLADAGWLSKALELCDELIRTQSELPDVYSLAGVIHQAEGRLVEAADFFRKTLYLAPNHVEALTQMIVLCDVRGEDAQAANYRRRLNRIEIEGAT